MNGVDIETAVKAPFRDSDWVVKSLLGLVWYILGVTVPAVIGAALDYVARVARGHQELPEWDEFGSKWVRGFLVMVGGFIYSLPLLLLGLIVLAPTIVIAAVSDSDAAGVVLALAAVFFGVVALVYGIILSIFYFAALTHYAIRGNFGALFEVGEIWRRVRGNGSYWMAWIFAIAISFGGSIASALLTLTGIGVLLIPAVAYLQLMMTAHLFGQWAAEAYPEVHAAAPAPEPEPAPAT